MMHFFSKYLSVFGDGNTNPRNWHLKIGANKFSAFAFSMIVVLFIVYHLLVNQYPLTPKMTFLNNNNISLNPKFGKIYSLIPNIKEIPEYITEVMDKVKSPAQCLIIIRSADGGIGNRMFLFASAYGLARLHQCELYVAPWIIIDLRSIFTINLSDTPVHLITNDSVVNQTGIYGRYSACTLYDDLMKIPLNPNLTRYEMIGFYQAYGYFIKYKSEVAYLFQFKQNAIEANVPLVEQLLKAVWNIPLNLGNYTKENVTHRYLKSLLTRQTTPLIAVTWIGIHIRRGDFLTFFHLDTSLRYLTLAMNHYRRKYVNCRFLIASDDKAYVKTNLGNNSDVFVTPKSFHAGDDLAALALCEHTIATAGTYSWWAAWLAGGDVIHDIHYPVAGQNCIHTHYFPPWFIFPHNESYQNSK